MIRSKQTYNVHNANNAIPNIIVTTIIQGMSICITSPICFDSTEKKKRLQLCSVSLYIHK